MTEKSLSSYTTPVAESKSSRLSMPDDTLSPRARLGQATSTESLIISREEEAKKAANELTFGKRHNSEVRTPRY